MEMDCTEEVDPLDVSVKVERNLSVIKEDVDLGVMKTESGGHVEIIPATGGHENHVYMKVEKCDEPEIFSPFTCEITGETGVTNNAGEELKDVIPIEGYNIQYNILGQPNEYICGLSSFLTEQQESAVNENRHSETNSRENLEDNRLIEKESFCIQQEQRSVDYQNNDKELEPFICVVCNLHFTKSNEFRNHVKSHPGLKVYICDICNYTVNNKTTLESHINIHTGLKPYECKFCGKCFRREQSLQDHVQFHMKCTYKCIHCNKEYRHSSSFRRHKTYRCSASSRRIEQKQDAQHYEKEDVTHSDAVQTSPSVSRLSDVPNEESGVNTLSQNEQCRGSQNSNDNVNSREVDDKILTGSASVELDEISDALKNRCMEEYQRLSDTENLYVCVTCKKCFTEKETLLQHVKTHVEQTDYNCCMCNKYFKDKEDLISHSKIHSEIFPHKCEICDERFKHKKMCIDHVNSHTRKYNYKCSHCDKEYTFRHSYDSHLLSLRSGPYKCNVCDKSFTCKSLLVRHQLTHSSVRFKCDICSNVYLYKSTLTRHKKVHKYKKPFKCEICNKEYVWKHLFQLHKMDHTQDWPFKCQICNMGYKEKRFLIHHEKKHLSFFL